MKMVDGQPDVASGAWQLSALLYRLESNGERTDFPLLEPVSYPYRWHSWHVELTAPAGTSVPDLDDYQKQSIIGRAHGESFEAIEDGMRRPTSVGTLRAGQRDLNSRLGAGNQTPNTIAKLIVLGVIPSEEMCKVRASQRQAQVLGAAALGIEYLDLPALLGVGFPGIRRYVRDAYSKLGVNRRRAAVLAAFEAGILTIGSTNEGKEP